MGTDFHISIRVGEGIAHLHKVCEVTTESSKRIPIHTRLIGWIKTFQNQLAREREREREREASGYHHHPPQPPPSQSTKSSHQIFQSKL
jgi:hypothetical protein